MPIVSLGDVEIAYEMVGEGQPLVFCHEFASDMRAWHHQMRWFGRTRRCIAYNYRGYPPSSVPLEDGSYEHGKVVDDLRRLMAALEIERADIVGVATGGNVALNLAISHPDLIRSLVLVGAGAGSVQREAWLAGARALATAIESDGMDALVSSIEAAPQRRALRIKDPFSWDEFIGQMRELSPEGCSRMMREALVGRRSLFDLTAEIAGLRMPILVLVGDQDLPAFESSIHISRTASHAALCVFPLSGHLLPVEEPALFNEVVGGFLASVEVGRWGAWRASQG